MEAEVGRMLGTLDGMDKKMNIMREDIGHIKIIWS